MTWTLQAVVALTRKAAAIKFGLLLFLAFGFAFPTIAESKVLIVYPEMREPYSEIFREMIAGFRGLFIGDSQEVAISGDAVQAIRHQLGAFEPDMIIALGSMTLNTVRNADSGLPVLVGALTNLQESGVIGGVSMLPNAKIYIDELLRIYPKTQRVFFVYNPEKDIVLRQEAEMYLLQKGIVGSAYPAREIRESAVAYKKLLAEAEAGDAIWLFPSVGLVNSSLLSDILDIAWKKRLAVFSSNPAHVKRGALFALYPDNQGVGRRLALMANAFSLEGKKSMPIETLQDIKVAVNARTSDHLGLVFADEVKNRIDLFLPGR